MLGDSGMGKPDLSSANIPPLKARRKELRNNPTAAEAVLETSSTTTDARKEVSTTIQHKSIGVVLETIRAAIRNRGAV
jgi:hypothetical protein